MILIGYYVHYCEGVIVNPQWLMPCPLFLNFDCRQDGEQKVETKSWNLPVGIVTAHSPMRTAHVSHLGSEMVVALPIRHHLSRPFIPYSPRLSDDLQQDHHVNNNNVDVDLHRHFNLLFHHLAHHSLIDLMGWSIRIIWTDMGAQSSLFLIPASLVFDRVHWIVPAPGHSNKYSMNICTHLLLYCN